MKIVMIFVMKGGDNNKLKLLLHLDYPVLLMIFTIYLYLYLLYIKLFMSKNYSFTLFLPFIEIPNFQIYIFIKIYFFVLFIISLSVSKLYFLLVFYVSVTQCCVKTSVICDIMQVTYVTLVEAAPVKFE